MGVIQKQSITGTIYSYVGVLLGFITTGLLLPRLLTTDEVGLLRILVSYSTLLAQFATLGFNFVTIKFFPYFRDKEKNYHGFLGLALIVGLLGFLLTASVYMGFHNPVVEHARQKSALFIPYYYYVVPLIFFTLLFGIFDTYYRVLYNAVKGIVYKEIVQRSLILISILLYYFKVVDFHVMVIIYTLAIISPAIFLLFALIKDKLLFIKPDFGFIDKKMIKQMLSVAFFGIIASYSGVLVMNIDVIMVDHYLGLGQAGIYTIAFFFGTLILVPMRTMGKIGSVVIADAWKKNDKSIIFDIYQKSTLSLGVIGLLLFIGVIGNLNNVFSIIGKDYEAGKYVILFIGLANVSDIFMGISPQIIANSKYYRWLSYLMLVFAVLVIGTNLIFIPMYGITGAALASFISKFIYNTLKYIFLYKKFHFQPFNYKHLLILLLAGLSLGLSTLIPAFNSFIIDIIVRSMVIGLLFLLPVYFFKVSNEINSKVDQILRRLFSVNK